MGTDALGRTAAAAAAALLAHPRRAVALLLAACAAVVVLHLTPAAGTLSPVLLLLSGCFAAVALPVGTALHRPRSSTAWQRMGLAVVLLLAGAVVRPWSYEQAGLLHYAADACTMGGYLFFGSGLVRLVRAHGGLRREVLCDALVLTVAGALAALSHLVLPAVDVTGRPLAVTVLAGAYPLVDVVFLALALDLLLTAGRRTSHQLLAGTVAAMLAGDLGYAVLGTSGDLVGPPVMDAPFAIGFLLVGAAALHPSQRAAAPAAAPADGGAPHAWSARRLVLLGTSLAGLLAAVAVPGPEPELHRWASALALAAAFALLVVRAVSAVNGHARARAVLQRRASHDALTDLPSRAEVERLLAEAQAACGPEERLWVLALDLDGFKRVNDAFGHAVGDEVLRRTARRLAALRPDVLGRLAADEFALAVTGCEQRARDLAEAVLASVAVPVRIGAAEVVVAASVGLAPAVDGPAAALRDADAAVQRAKAAGRARCAVFDESMRRDTAEEVELERDLRRAVASGGLQVAYQPVVDVVTERPAGVEALLRWTRPGAGPVSPVRFVPLLEATGLITEVGLQVLRESVGQLARWRADGTVDASFVMSVNVSPRQLLDRTFPAVVRRVLEEAGVEGSALLLEITESSVLEEDPQTLQGLHDLRALGVGLAVDDFGTGYSALSYLRRFPVTRVKVDRSFVDGLCTDPSDAALVRAVEAMSRALGLAVTAEGVETAEQRDALRAMGVRHGQGWLWGRAEPAEVCAALLRSAGRSGCWTDPVVLRA